MILFKKQQVSTTKKRQDAELPLALNVVMVLTDVGCGCGKQALSVV